MKEKIIPNEQLYDSLADEYKKREEMNLPLFIKEVIPRILTKVKKGKYLDLGCAVGVHMKVFEKLGFEVSGIDISPKMIKYARQKNPSSEIILGNFASHKFKSKFDLILALAFVHLFPKKDVGKIFTKISSLLNKKGIAVITTTKNTWSEEGYFKKEDYNKKPIRFRKKWTKEELSKELEKYFEIVDYYERTDSFNKSWMIYLVKKNKRFRA